MRVVMVIVGFAAALVFITASATMNYLFASSLGKTAFEGLILGAVSVAADIIKALLPVLIMRAATAQRYVFVAVGTAMFVFFSTFSMLAALGFAASNRGEVTGMKVGLNSRHAEVAQQLQSIDARIKLLGSYRPASMIEELLAAARNDRRWLASTSCTNPTSPSARGFCEGYFSLRAELGGSEEGKKLEVQADALRQELATLKSRGAGSEPDPQVRILTKIFGGEADGIERLLIVVGATLVESGAAFGLYLASGSHTKDLPKQSAQQVEKKKRRKNKPKKAMPPILIRRPASVLQAQVLTSRAIVAVSGDALGKFEGALYSVHDGNGWAILFNSAVSNGRRRFTIAHEFGHYLMHRTEKPEGFRCSEDDVTFRDGLDMENEADTFAAYLLMPFDDFRAQLPADAVPSLDDFSALAERYGVSLISCVLRWLEYTERRSMLIVSVDDFILWSKSSDAALRSGLYYKTKNVPPVEVPSQSTVMRRDMADLAREGVEHPPGVWLAEACTEITIHSDKYGQAITILHYGRNSARSYHGDEPDEADAFDRFSPCARDRFGG